MRRIVRVGSALLFLAAVLAVERPQASGPSGNAQLPDASALAVQGGAQPVAAESRFAASKGQIEVVVGLVDAPLARAQGDNFKQRGGKLNPGQQKAYLSRNWRKPTAFVNRR